MLFSTLKNNNIEKCPFTYWLNGRWFLQIVDRDSWNLYPLYPLFPCFSNVGGGGVMFFSYVMLFTTFIEHNFFGNTKNISFFMFFYAGNIEKCPFTYWLNGRWFLQIVDIHVGNFDMKLTGSWFPQIVDRDSGNLYPIYIKQKLWC